MKIRHALALTVVVASAILTGASPASAAAVSAVGSGLTATSAPAAADPAPGSGCDTATLVAVNTSNSNLYRWTRPTPTSGAFTSAAQVGKSWGGIRLTALDSATGYLYAVDTSGNLRRYVYTGSGFTGGGVVGGGWSTTTSLIPAGNGTLYAVRSDGTLWWYHWIDTSTDLRSGMMKIGSGWDSFSLVASGGNGILYAVRKDNGNLMWYRHNAPGLGLSNWQGPRQVGSGWGSMRALVGLGGGVLYGVTSGGLLMSYTNTGYLTGAATWSNNGTGVQIGSGWTGYDRLTGNPTACPIPQPTRADGTENPVYFVHGMSPLRTPLPYGAGWDCDSYWSDVRHRFTNLGWTGPMLQLGYYAGDKNCDIFNNGDLDTPIVDSARSFAWYVYNHNSLYGQTVEVIAHSLGGLVVRDAITRVEAGDTSFPPYLFIDNVVTLDSPHQGAVLAIFCDSFGKLTPQQCVDVKPNSPFLASLGWNPQSTISTDWTTIGVHDDDTVPYLSTIGQANTTVGAMQPGHMVMYDDGQFGRYASDGSPHMGMLWATGQSGTTGSTGFSLWHSDYHTLALGRAGQEATETRYGYNGWYWPSTAPSPADYAFQAASHWWLW